MTGSKSMTIICLINSYFINPWATEC